MKSSLIALSATALIACGLLSGPARAADADDPMRLELAIKHAGEPVDHVTFFPSKRSRSYFANSWELLGEREVLVWHGREKAWLVQLRGGAACRSLEKERVMAASGGFADLKADGYFRTRNSTCRIDQIRPVDVAAMKADEALAKTALAEA